MFIWTCLPSSSSDNKDFEKTLYDNALLAEAFVEYHQVTNNWCSMCKLSTLYASPIRQHKKALGAQ